MSHLILFLLLAGVAVQTVRSGYRAWRSSERSDTMRTVRAVRWWMPFTTVAVVAPTVGLILALMQLPGFSWGWWQLLAGNPGNIVLGQTTDPHPVFRAFALLIPVAFMFAIPREALAEERLFRQGGYRRSVWKRIGVAFAFGMMHCLVGVPIAVGIGLGFMGLYLDAVYEVAFRAQYDRFRELVAEPGASIRVDGWPVSVEDGCRMAADVMAATKAAAAHAVSNWMVLGVLFVALAVT